MSVIANENKKLEQPPKPVFDSFFFGSGFGYICYYFMRNDWVWSRLNNQEKEFVKQHNNYWNNNNPGYKDPSEYQGQGGLSFRSIQDRQSSWEGRQLAKFLEQERPKRVLEIGPGSGYYTRQIIECGSLDEYVATDINAKFLEFIEKAISEHDKGIRIKSKFVQLSDLESTDMQVDAIILLSALHHIPDREIFIKAISRYLTNGGAIFFFEPSHSLARIVQLAWSFALHRWYSTKVVRLRNNYMTHHFCTVSEMRKNAEYAGLKLEAWGVMSKLPDSIKYLAAPFSRKMIAILRK
jgi:ubiquinone/menaquinone biosynthesis C-methylase UbiE